ncbi:galactokinase [Friedmanniomyces endolithicus]|nr:galactokinase [Friedmanniomyces endolithicus]
MEVPTAKSLSEIYPENAVESQTRRWNSLISKFREDYGKLPDFISRSPGRVNIIGEHIDYCLYEVLPMAITADVLLAVSVHPEESGPSTVRLVNVHPQKFESKNFDIPDTGDVHIDPSTLEWTNYFKSGLSGATELLRSKRKDFKQSVGMDIQADGSVPSGGGLSSSAAFVCASALAAMKANGVDKVDKKELVEVAITSERAVGVNSGGMDQSASVFPVQGSALYVSFVPELSAENIAFPQMKSPLVFVIAQSFVAADKHVTAPVCYNLRVVEVTLAALVLAKILRVKSLPSDAGPLGVSLRGFHDTYFQEIEGIKNNHTVSKVEFQDQLQSLVGKVDQYLPQEEGYTRQQLSEILGMSVDEIGEEVYDQIPDPSRAVQAQATRHARLQRSDPGPALQRTTTLRPAEDRRGEHGVPEGVRIANERDARELPGALREFLSGAGRAVRIGALGGLVWESIDGCGVGWV